MPGAGKGRAEIEDSADDAALFETHGLQVVEDLHKSVPEGQRTGEGRVAGRSGPFPAATLGR